MERTPCHALRSPAVPKLRHHKARDLAVVRLDGKDHYLGRFGSPESRAEYDRLIAEWLTSGRRSPTSPVARNGATVDEVVLAFWRHAEAHYRKPDGRPTGELENFRHALKPLRRLYGPTPAAEFGPLALRAVREAMVDSGLARTTTNARVNRIRRVFKWACSVELVPPAVVQGLPGRRRPAEGPDRGPRSPEGSAPWRWSTSRSPSAFMPRPVAAMVRLQLLTGCRVGEVVAMRGCDLTLGRAVRGVPAGGPQERLARPWAGHPAGARRAAGDRAGLPQAGPVRLPVLAARRGRGLPRSDAGRSEAGRPTRARSPGGRSPTRGARYAAGYNRNSTGSRSSGRVAAPASPPGRRCSCATPRPRRSGRGTGWRRAR